MPILHLHAIIATFVTLSLEYHATLSIEVVKRDLIYIGETKR